MGRYALLQSLRPSRSEWDERIDDAALDRDLADVPTDDEQPAASALALDDPAIVPEVEPLGATLRQARQARGLTLAAVAAHVGLHLAWLSNVETGRRSPRLATLERIADVLGLHLALVPGRVVRPEPPAVVPRVPGVCRRGIHTISEVGTYTSGRRYRTCRACALESARRRRGNR